MALVQTSDPAAPGGTVREQRRSQLLAAAADLVTEAGVAALTMEAMAALAGVSKALPYRHFANADDALVALYHQEIASVRRRILEAIDGLSGDAVIEAAVGAYMDAVVDRGPLLTVLAGAGSSVPELAEGPERRAPAVVVQLIGQAYGVRGRPAAVLAGVVTAIAIAVSETYGRGELKRADAERTAVAAIRGAVASVRGLEKGRPKR